MLIVIRANATVLGLIVASSWVKGISVGRIEI